jgi:DNA polymerase elongation subunit (family B)
MTTANAGPIVPINSKNILEDVPSNNVIGDSNALILGKQQQLQQLIPRSKTAFEEEILPLLDKAAGMDLEWSIKDRKKGVYCACFYPVVGQPINIHIDDFGKDKVKFATAVLETMKSFSVIIGHNIKSHNSDFYQLKRMLIKYPNLREQLDNIPYIDTFKLFKMTFVDNMLSQLGLDYHSLELGVIADALLGEGKYQGYTGENIEDEPNEVQLAYCSKDAELALRIVQHDKWSVFRVLHSLQKISDLSFLSICNAYSSKIGEGILALNGLSNAMTPAKYRDGKRIEYGGAFVIKPVPGVYFDILGLDYMSMYPSIIIAANASSETLNCGHEICKTKGRYPPTLMWQINDGLMEKGEDIIEEWWYKCTLKTGILPNIMLQLRAEKKHFKDIGDIYGEKGRKLTMNGIYGMFQDDDFKFRDQRIGLVITGFGRIWINELLKKAPEYGIEGIYADTDSIFGRAIPGKEVRLNEFTDYVEQRYGATLERDKEWSVLLIKAAKSYFGITKDGKFHRKKMWGMRSNNTLLQKQLMSKVVNKEILELYGKDADMARNKILDDIKPIFVVANESAMEENKFSFKATKEVYERKGYQREVYLELKEKGSPMTIGTRYYYYKINPVETSDGNGGMREKKFTTHPLQYTLDIEKIKEGLVNCVNIILQAYGIDIDKELTN